ncbi:hypothetical protein KCU89_g7963, partial [Aureobasidium melanogenum]
VDEPLYINKTTWYSLGMLLRHPEMYPKVAIVFSGRAASLDEDVVKKIRDFATHHLPYLHEHNDESRAEAQAEWDEYEATI